MEVRHITVSIDRPPTEVYGFAARAENLPRWAAGLCRTMRHLDGEWVGDGPLGTVRVRFVERNPFGVLDHDVVLPTGATVHNAIRVVPNGAGSEVTFTLLRRPSLSAEEFARDATAVKKDLLTLKTLLEESRYGQSR